MPLPHSPRFTFFVFVGVIFIIAFWAISSAQTANSGQLIGVNFSYTSNPDLGADTTSPDLYGEQEPPVITCSYDTQASQAGRDACHGNCGPGKCCDYKLDAQGQPTQECECHSDANPCGDDPAKCLTCMAYAEAGGSTINNQCMRWVMCAALNRVGKKEFGNKKNVCDVIAAGNGTQFNSYKCVCNNQDPNQKYCACCNGTITNPQELAEVEAARQLAQGLTSGSSNCAGFTGNSFNNTGLSSYNSRNCTRVTTPTPCPTFDFFRC